MPIKQGCFPANIFTAATYSPAVVVGDLVYVSGQGPISPETKSIAGDTFEAQVELTFRNVEAALKSADCVLDDCVKVNAYLLDLANFDRFNAVYKDIFREPYPARTTVGAQLWHGIQIEIDVVAVRNCRVRDQTPAR
jgi:2-iminobutanoate/2-iminopropanoate deaminase